MKVFISWSGTSSKAVALALRDWLPVVIQDIEPWMSEEDIAKGKRWRTTLDQELKTANVGIICLTPDNLKEPFILFEAGAIAKAVEESYACTYLYNLKPGDIEEPLGAFQHTMTTKDETKKLIQTLNKANKEHVLQEKVIDAAFENSWPVLEIKLAKVPQTSAEVEPKRTTDDKIDEILLAVRNLQSNQNQQGNEERVNILKNLLVAARLENEKDMMAHFLGRSSLTEAASAGQQQVTGARPPKIYHRRRTT